MIVALALFFIIVAYVSERILMSIWRQGFRDCMHQFDLGSHKYLIKRIWNYGRKISFALDAYAYVTH
jgi:ABC-type transport system involved in Fe-S cluster assembly fused permease/ATPase subunit